MELVSSESLSGLRRQDPADKATWGPIVWKAFHGIAESIPCDGCRNVAVRVMRGFHDAVNVELRKPVRFPSDMAYGSFFFQRGVSNAKGGCPARAGRCRYNCSVDHGCVPK